MIEITLSFWHRIRNSSPGGLRPSTLPLGHGGSPQYWLSHVDGEETVFVSFKPPRTEPESGWWHCRKWGRAENLILLYTYPTFRENIRLNMIFASFSLYHNVGPVKSNIVVFSFFYPSGHISVVIKYLKKYHFAVVSHLEELFWIL